MIKSVNIIIYNSVNKVKIKEFENLSLEEANLIIPTDGFIRLNFQKQIANYKVQQIVKEIATSIFVSEGTTLNVHIFVNKVTSNDYFLM